MLNLIKILQYNHRDSVIARHNEAKYCVNLEEINISFTIGDDFYMIHQSDKKKHKGFQCIVGSENWKSVFNEVDAICVSEKLRNLLIKGIHL